MDKQEAGKLLWESSLQGRYYPYALQGRLTLEQAYPVQLDVLGRNLEAGQVQAGWKIGLTADAVRAHFKSKTAVHGYLLAGNGARDGKAFDFDQVISPSIEAELCFRLRKDLHGPGVSARTALDAVENIFPAFEILERRGDMAADLPLGVADNISQWAYVLGKPPKPFPKSIDLGGVKMELLRNGEVAASGTGRDVIDNQLESLAWLANRLTTLGKSLEAGQIVLTGSFNRPLPINKGDRWEASFSGIGAVSCSFT